jgi:hypothetical protein
LSQAAPAVSRSGVAGANGEPSKAGGNAMNAMILVLFAALWGGLVDMCRAMFGA